MDGVFGAGIVPAAKFSNEAGNLVCERLLGDEN